VISGVILAAGTSSRLGRPKQLLDLGGTPVLAHVTETALASPLEEVVVVLGHLASAVATAVPERPRLRRVVNERFAEGQSTSLAAGLRALSPRCAAAVILLGDQPGITSDAIRAVVETFRRGGKPVAQATYEGRPAHPTLIARAVWEEILSAAEGDHGAGPVLAGHPEWVERVEVGGQPPDDIDTEADYERLRAQFDAP
jgi:molybdenum cofactor cytidylyltransferase